MKDRLKQLRKALDLSQRDLAKRLEIKPGTIGPWETGKEKIPKARIYQICKEFNVNRTWLETGEGEMFGEDQSIHDRLKIARLALGLKQREIAEKLGVSTGRVGSWESGYDEPGQARLYQFCNEFKINRAWIETGEGEMFVHEVKEVPSFEDEMYEMYLQLSPEKQEAWRRLAVRILVER